MEMPSHFLTIPYDYDQYPGCPNPMPFKSGANCQRFAYELLRHFGYEIGDLRSSDLWEDKKWTFPVKDLRPLDLLLFNRGELSYGAHVGVYIGDNRIIHNCQKIGISIIWSFEQFRETAQYKFYIGAKRTRPKFRSKGTIKQALFFDNGQ